MVGYDRTQGVSLKTLPLPMCLMTKLLCCVKITCHYSIIQRSIIINARKLCFFRCVSLSVYLYVIVPNVMNRSYEILCR